MKYKHLFLLSFLGHLFFYNLLCMQLHFSTKKINFEVKDNILPAYVFQPNVKAQVIKSEKKSIADEALRTLPPSMKRFQKQVTSSPPRIASLQTTAKIETGKPLPELLALLHAAIQAKQHYPESALEMQREGKTTLNFVLLPNGNIEKLQIIKSSGTVVLDEAALAAVNHALPFKGINQYLKRPQVYSVSVVFELT